MSGDKGSDTGGKRPPSVLVDFDDSLDLKSPGTSDTGGTAATTTTTTTTTSAASTSSSETLTTPSNVCSKLQRYEDLHISPGSLIGFDKVQMRVDADGILEGNFIKERLDVKCIYYLYGIEYKWTQSQEERVEAIRECLEDYGARRRLGRIVVSEASDRILVHQSSRAEEYLNVASTARLFFHDQNANGGFPKDAIVRYQRSRNCYLPAVCVWYFVQCQADMPDDENVKPIDMAHVARNFVIKDDESFEKRVIHDKGESAIDLAVRISGRPMSIKDWDMYDFQMPSNFRRGKSREKWTARQDLDVGEIHDQVGSGCIGLVTGFFTYPNFYAAKSKESRLGYWKYIGESCDTKGVFVYLQKNHGFEEHRERLNTLWNQQVEAASQHRQEQRANLDLFLPQNLFQDEAPRPKPEQTPPTPGSGSYHGMVLLGTKKVQQWDYKLNRMKEDYHFMLLNWWEGMPLVLVSRDYLVACGAKIYMLKDPLTERNTALKDAPALIGECFFQDGGDNRIGTLSFESGEDDE
jgi:hypothetical protein